MDERRWIKLNRVSDGAHATILAKIEGRNPAYSVKDRIGASMIWDAEKRGVLGPGKELIEPTSGNTGIALAFVAAARGYPITLIMPETMSVERRKVLRAFGANLILTEGAAGMQAVHLEGRGDSRVRSRPLRAAAAISESRQPGDPFQNHRAGNLGGHPRRHRCSGQRRGNRRDHHGHLALHQERSEKENPFGGGGARGQSRYHADQKGEPLQPGPHKIQGIGAGFIPGTLDLAMVDRVELVTNEESIEMARRLAREEGILSGISSGAAVAAAVRIAKEPRDERQDSGGGAARFR